MPAKKLRRIKNTREVAGILRSIRAGHDLCHGQCIMPQSKKIASPILFVKFLRAIRPFVLFEINTRSSRVDAGTGKEV
jgi:hypothetical protein